MRIIDDKVVPSPIPAQSPESRIKALEAEVERLSAELSACTTSPGGCGYWREAARLRAGEASALAERIKIMRDMLEKASTMLENEGAWELPRQIARLLEQDVPAPSTAALSPNAQILSALYWIEQNSSIAMLKKGLLELGNSEETVRHILDVYWSQPNYSILQLFDNLGKSSNEQTGCLRTVLSEYIENMFNRYVARTSA